MLAEQHISMDAFSDVYFCFIFALPSGRKHMPAPLFEIGLNPVAIPTRSAFPIDYSDITSLLLVYVADTALSMAYFADSSALA